MQEISIYFEAVGAANDCVQTFEAMSSEGQNLFRRLHRLYIGRLPTSEDLFRRYVWPMARSLRKLGFADLSFKTPRWDSRTIAFGEQTCATSITFAVIMDAPCLDSIVSVLYGCPNLRSVRVDWSSYISRRASKDLASAHMMDYWGFERMHAEAIELFFAGLYSRLHPVIGDFVQYCPELRNVILTLPRAWVRLGEAAVETVAKLNGSAENVFILKIEERVSERNSFLW